MTQLQFGTPHKTKLETVASELAISILESLKGELNSVEVPFESYQVLERSVIAELLPYLRAYRSDANDGIFLLKLPDALEGLVGNISEKTLQSVRLTLEGETADTLNRRIKSNIHQELLLLKNSCSILEKLLQTPPEYHRMETVAITHF